MGIVLGVVGSRTFSDTERGFGVLDGIHRRLGIDTVVSGGAKSGGDYVAELWAEARNIPVIVHYAQWDKYGKGAGFIRNVDIVDDSDRILAFWDGRSKGTKHTLDTAKKKGKLRRIVYFVSEADRETESPTESKRNGRGPGLGIA